MDQETTPVEMPDDARAFQKNLLEFLHGREIDWSAYGCKKQITNVTLGGYDSVELPAELEARCDMINRVVRDPANGA